MWCDARTGFFEISKIEIPPRAGEVRVSVCDSAGSQLGVQHALKRLA